VAQAGPKARQAPSGGGAPAAKQAAALVASAPSPQLMQLYQEYCLKFNKQGCTADKHFEAFSRSLEEIVGTNLDDSATYWAGLTPASDLTSEEFAAQYCESSLEQVPPEHSRPGAWAAWATGRAGGPGAHRVAAGKGLAAQPARVWHRVQRSIMVAAISPAAAPCALSPCSGRGPASERPGALQRQQPVRRRCQARQPPPAAVAALLQELGGGGQGVAREEPGRGEYLVHVRQPTAGAGQHKHTAHRALWARRGPSSCSPLAGPAPGRLTTPRPLAPPCHAQCGSCMAFSAVAAVESALEIAGWPRADLSEQQLVSCMYGDLNDGTNWCASGAAAPTVFGYLRDRQIRITTESQWPYTSGSAPNSPGACSQRPSSGATITNFQAYAAKFSRDGIKAAVLRAPVSVYMHMASSQNCECAKPGGGWCACVATRQRCSASTLLCTQHDSAQ
jgi:hypothetical protein